MRKVRVSTVNTRKASDINEQTASVLARATENIRLAGKSNPDLVLLSELFANRPDEHNRDAYLAASEPLDGDICRQMSVLAKEVASYVAFGLLRRDGNRIFNSLVLLDRQGECVWVYDKTTPMIAEIQDYGITPGIPSVYDCDFGRVGGVICFDINFTELAEYYQRNDVELLLFSSAFPAGRLLDAWSQRYGFAIAASSWYDSNRIIDQSANTVAHTSDLTPYATAVLNLDRRVVHMDGNLPKIQQMVDKYGPDVLVEDMRDEGLVVISSLKEGLSISELIGEFDIELMHDYFDRSRSTSRSQPS